MTHTLQHSMLFRKSIWDRAQILPTEERGSFFDYLLAYAFGVEPQEELDGGAEVLFAIVKDELDEDIQAMEAKNYRKAIKRAYAEEF